MTLEPMATELRPILEPGNSAWYSPTGLFTKKKGLRRGGYITEIAIVS